MFMTLVKCSISFAIAILVKSALESQAIYLFQNLLLKKLPS